MKFMYWGKDGGTESTVWGFWPVEIKSLFSVAFLKFVGASREAYHNHAFNSISWILKGQLEENFRGGLGHLIISRSIYAGWKPVITKRTTFHKVNSVGTTWVLTFRGPWSKTWNEEINGTEITLTSGRVRVA